MHARLRGSKSLSTLYQIINKPDFPSLADGIAEPHPDMNIKVAAFKDICGYFQCAPFPRLQTGKVVWVLSFDP